MRRGQVFNIESQTIGYVRVSSREQKERGYSVDDQISDILRYAEKHELKLCESDIIVDAGVSAGSLKRTGIQSILKSLPQGKIKNIIIKNNSRLTRAQIDRYALDCVFDKYNINILCIEGRWKAESVNEEIGTGLQVFLDEHQRKQVSPDTIRGMRQSAIDGNFPLGGYPPRGYKKIPNEIKGVKLEPIEEYVEHIRFIFESLKSRTQTKKSLARHYSKEKIMGYNWTDDDINSIFNNHIYYGRFIKWDLDITDHTPPIITKELFEAAHIAQEKQTRLPRHFYIYGGMVYCDNCKSYCTRECVIKKNKNGETKVHLYHFCPACKSRINDIKLDKTIARVINQQALPSEKYELLVKITKNIKRKEARIGLYESEFDNLLLDKDEFKEKVIKTKKEIFKLQDEITKIENTNPTKYEELSKYEKRSVALNKIEIIKVDFEKDKECDIILKKRI